MTSTSVTLAPKPRAIFGRVGADDAAADDGDVGWRNARDAAEKNAAAAALFFKIRGANLDAHASGDFAHGREQGQGALAVADGFIGDADDLGLEELVGENGKRSEVKVGEEDQAFAEVDVLLLDGLLDLDDHVGFAPDIAGVANDLRTGVLVARRR